VTPLLPHLENQLESARRLLGLVLAQRDAIKSQDVETLLARLADVQGELAVRQRLEVERDAILREAGVRLGLDPDRVDLDAIVADISPDEAARARALSAELKGVLREVGRVHDQNRVLIAQELSFLGHLMRILSGAPQAGYSPDGWLPNPQPAATVDARA
jgi:hypothetical protein